MDIAVRAFVFDEDDKFLIVKHASWQPWCLPGGHIEEGETMFTALEREMQEEFGLPVTIIWSDTVFSEHTIVSLPLPIGIHKVKYDHRTKWSIEKMEYVFFARTDGEIEQTDEEEIFDWKWVSQEDFLSMDAWRETFASIQDMLEQHGDLLEIL